MKRYFLIILTLFFIVGFRCATAATSTVTLIVGEGCGNSYIENSEVCDDGNNISCDGCRSDCTRLDNICGDGYLECGEECDGSLGVPNGYICSDQCILYALSNIDWPEIFEDVRIYAVSAEAAVDSAVVSWVNNKKAYCRLEWGETQESMDGKIDGAEKTRFHKANLTGLKPNFNYYFQIFCWDGFGHKAQTLTQKFKTKQEIDREAPANARDFTVIVVDGKAKLDWKNPLDKDFIAVRIVRSEEFYPQKINEGISIYNDSGESADDSDVVIGKKYYYTIFAYDNNSNYSSGAIAWVEIEEGEPGSKILPLAKEAGSKISTIARGVGGLNLNDFIFSVADNTIELKLASSSFSLFPETRLNASIVKEKCPPDFKSIIFAIMPKSSAESSSIKSYLLRIDSEDEKYQADIIVPSEIKNYDFYFIFLSGDSSEIGRIQGLLKIKKFGRIIKKQEGLNGKTDVPIKGVKVALFSIENGNLERWPGHKFSQFNPTISNAAGHYDFLVKNGRYFLKVEKKGFYSYTGPIFAVENNLINQDIELIEKPRFHWEWFLLFAVLLVAYLGVKNIVKKFLIF